MSTISNYLEIELLDHVLKVGSFTPPANIYVALSTTNPGEDASGLNEPSYGSYARVSHNSWDVASSRATENTGQISFPQATAGSATVTHWALFDASSGGNMLGYGSFSEEKEIVTGNTPRIADGQIDISFLTSGISNYLANELLDHVFGNGSYTAPTNLYIGLSLANPDDDGSGISEPMSISGYGRAIHNDWDAAVAGATRNASGFVFPDSTGPWDLVRDIFISDAASSGNLLIYGFIADSGGDANPQSVGTGDTVQVVASGLVITLD